MTVYVLLWDDNHKQQWKARAVFDSEAKAEAHRDLLVARAHRHRYRPAAFLIRAYDLNRDTILENVNLIYERLMENRPLAEKG